jgi:hypothetical protein
LAKSQASSSMATSGWITGGLLVFDYFSASVSWGLAPIVGHAMAYWWYKSSESATLDAAARFHEYYLCACFGCVLAVCGILLLATHRESRQSVCRMLLLVGVSVAFGCYICNSDVRDQLLELANVENNWQLSSRPKGREIIVKGMDGWWRAVSSFAVASILTAGSALTLF